MPATFDTLVLDAHDPEGQARFWSGVLSWGGDGLTLVPPYDGFRLRVQPGEEPKRGPNQLHFDLTSTSLADQQAIVDRVLAHGGSHLDIGQGPDVDHVVMADPEGNELCVIAPGNNFLAGCPDIGALSSDGTQAVGYFWSEALGWPLVWDQDEETAIQSPTGGSKISWGGPPVGPKRGKNRFHLDLVVPADELVTETERLLGLGASRLDLGQGDDHVVLADPDGNELCLRPR